MIWTSNALPLAKFSLYEEIRKIDNKVNVCFIIAFEINYQTLRAVFPFATTTYDIVLYIHCYGSVLGLGGLDPPPLIDCLIH